ncbi:MAG: FAD-dependent oxidoreductase [Halobacteriales archaeon]|nr:FAD-dependent oxidoreductase [Halobacteriales archaeon]
MAESYVIIGDGIAGSSAAETLREEDSDAEITVITEEGEALYNRILIKEFAKGKLPEAPLSIHDEDWYTERDITLRLNTLVTAVDTEAHEITTHDGDTLGYDKLLLATGGTPTQLPVPNADADGIHHFWTFQDARRIAEHAEAAETGLVIGAGLLGIDFAAICAAQGIDAHYLMRGKSWWRYAMTETGGEIIHDALSENGVEPVLDSGIEKFLVDDDGQLTGGIDANGQEYDAEFAGIAIGLNYNTEYIQDTDIETDNGIIVDEYMQTNVEDVYAAGDITKFYDVIIDQQNQNGSWGSAKEQGTVAARNMAADDAVEEFRWVPSYSITHFDFPFLSFGHPALGSEGPVTEGNDPNGVERKYGDNEWRRLVFKDGKLIGGVLIGNLAPQSAYKTLIREERVVQDQVDVLLEDQVDLDDLDAPAQEQAN